MFNDKSLALIHNLFVLSSPKPPGPVNPPKSSSLIINVCIVSSPKVAFEGVERSIITVSSVSCVPSLFKVIVIFLELSPALKVNMPSANV
ncbi:hypothetical protein ES705_45877 [subsurface metagenome]